MVLLWSVLDHRCIMHCICIGEFGVVADLTQLVVARGWGVFFWRKKNSTVDRSPDPTVPTGE